MEQKKLKSLLDNEREWRRHLISEVGEIKKVQHGLVKDVASLKVWAWLSRSAFVSLIGAVIYFIKDKLSKGA